MPLPLLTEFEFVPNSAQSQCHKQEQRQTPFASEQPWCVFSVLFPLPFAYPDFSTASQHHLLTLTPMHMLHLPLKRPLLLLLGIVIHFQPGVVRDLAVLHPQAMATVAHHPAAGLPNQGGRRMPQ